MFNKQYRFFKFIYISETSYKWNNDLTTYISFQRVIIFELRNNYQKMFLTR